MSLDLAELKRLAEAATPGPWQVSGVRVKMDDRKFLTVGADRAPITVYIAYSDLTHQEHVASHAEARFIAAANPATILSLLSLLARLDAERDKHSEHSANWLQEITRLDARCEALTTALREVSAALSHHRYPKIYHARDIADAALAASGAEPTGREEARDVIEAARNLFDNRVGHRPSNAVWSAHQEFFTVLGDALARLDSARSKTPAPSEGSGT